jgi:hypothetical protein
MSEPKLPPLPAPYIGAKARVGGEWAEYAESELRAYGLACYRQGFVEGARACERACDKQAEKAFDAASAESSPYYDGMATATADCASACAKIAEKGAADAS